MNDTTPGSLVTLAWSFGLMSLFAVGGANSAIPEIHRLAVDVNHWMSDKQFADVFAISQLSPGPNVLIVTLIGYQVAGIMGAWLQHWPCAGRRPCLLILSANCFRGRATRNGRESYRPRWSPYR
jgi:chromate transport protein ChrA